MYTGKGNEIFCIGKERLVAFKFPGKYFFSKYEGEIRGII